MAKSVTRELEVKKLPDVLKGLVMVAKRARGALGREPAAWGALHEVVYVTLVAAPAAYWPTTLPVVGLGDEVHGVVGLDDPRPKAEFTRAVCCASEYNGTCIEVAGLTERLAEEAATGEAGFLEALDITLDAYWKKGTR